MYLGDSNQNSSMAHKGRDNLVEISNRNARSLIEGTQKPVRSLTFPLGKTNQEQAAGLPIEKLCMNQELAPT